jgi:KipI family sensor histidine kinase inhibitor
MMRLGDRAVIIARPRSSARALVRAIRSWPGVIDVVVAERDVGIYFDRDPIVPDVSLDGLEEDEREVRTIELHAIYDGPDLDEIARAKNVTTEEIARLHRSKTYVVESMGFQPGFAYLIGLDPLLEMPRRRSPRTRVPAGSLGIGGHYTGVYPFDSPGGWNLIGRVRETMYDAVPLLSLGDRVIFA